VLQNCMSAPGRADKLFNIPGILFFVASLMVSKKQGCEPGVQVLTAVFNEQAVGRAPPILRRWGLN
jgi:hypothetical protein